jgi:hypothetical protein
VSGRPRVTTLIAGFCQVTLFREKANNQARDRIMPRGRDNSRPQILPRSGGWRTLRVPHVRLLNVSLGLGIKCWA